MNSFHLLLLAVYLLFISGLRIRTWKNKCHRKYMLSKDEDELVNQFPLVARVFISNLVKTIEAKEKLSRFLMAEANTRYLKVSGDLSIRRVLEESEQEDIVRLTKKRFKLEAQKQAKLIAGDNINKNVVPNLSKRDLWDRVLNDSNESKDRFPNLSLLRKELPVPGILADLFNFCSKRMHTNLPVQVFIDVEEYTPDQVKVARALCEDYPVRYVVARASELKDFLTGEGDEDLPGELPMTPPED